MCTISVSSSNPSSLVSSSSTSLSTPPSSQSLLFTFSSSWSLVSYFCFPHSLIFPPLSPLLFSSVPCTLFSSPFSVVSFPVFHSSVNFSFRVFAPLPLVEHLSREKALDSHTNTCTMTRVRHCLLPLIPPSIHPTQATGGAAEPLPKNNCGSS